MRRCCIMRCSEFSTICATLESSSTVVRGRRRFRSVAHIAIGVFLSKEWKVFLPNSFPGYISWEQYEANQETLRANPKATDTTGGVARHVRERHCCRAWSCVANAETA